MFSIDTLKRVELPAPSSRAWSLKRFCAAPPNFWETTHGDKAFRALADGQVLTAGGIELRAIATPGHSPGSTCLYAPALGAVFSGDTLFAGGPGATGRSFSDFGTILGSIKDKLGVLPADTVVYTGHGDSTTIGGEIVNYDDWVARGH